MFSSVERHGKIQIYPQVHCERLAHVSTRLGWIASACRRASTSNFVGLKDTLSMESLSLGRIHASRLLDSGRESLKNNEQEDRAPQVTKSPVKALIGDTYRRSELASVAR